MTDTFAKVSPGQPVRIKADTFNAMVDAARDCRNRVSQQGRTPQPVGSHSTGLIRVKNYANVDRARFAAQTINGMAFDPTDSDQLDQFQTEPLPTVHAPSTGEGRLLAILQEPIAAHGIGMAVINGFSVAYVNVIATTDTCADVTDGVVDYLTSGTSGPFTILSPLTATGQQWVAGKIDGGAAAEIDCIITAVTAVITDRQWTYTVQQITGKTTAGYGTGTAADWTHAAPDMTARNKMEWINTAITGPPDTSGTQGIGTTGAELRGLLLRPIPVGTPITCRVQTVVVSGTPAIEYWFGIPNGLGGTCTP